MKFVVNQVFVNHKTRQIERYIWDTFDNEETANEVALEVRETLPKGWTTEVKPVED
jgi:hypothetical protein